MSTEIEEKIQKLEEELEKLKSEVAEKENKNSNVRWRGIPFINKYWFINYGCEVTDNFEEVASMDDERFKIGNYFKTKEEAQHVAEMLKVKQHLKDIALRLNNGKEIDWEDNKRGKYRILLNLTKVTNTLDITCVRYTNSIGDVYCLSEDFLSVAIKEIGKDKLIELIKSGI